MDWFLNLDSSDFSELPRNGSEFVLAALKSDNGDELPSFEEFAAFRELAWNTDYRGEGPLIYQAGFQGELDKSYHCWDQVFSRFNSDASAYIVGAKHNGKIVGLVGMSNTNSVRYDRFWYFPPPSVTQYASQDFRHGVWPRDVQEVLCQWLRNEGYKELWGGSVKTGYGRSHYERCCFVKRSGEWVKDLTQAAGG